MLPIYALRDVSLLYHIFYVDDIILFCKGDNNTLHNFKTFLHDYLKRYFQLTILSLSVFQCDTTIILTLH